MRNVLEGRQVAHTRLDLICISVKKNNKINSASFKILSSSEKVSSFGEGKH